MEGQLPGSFSLPGRRVALPGLAEGRRSQSARRCPCHMDCYPILPSLFGASPTPLTWLCPLPARPRNITGIPASGQEPEPESKTRRASTRLDSTRLALLFVSAAPPRLAARSMASAGRSKRSIRLSGQRQQSKNPHSAACGNRAFAALLPTSRLVSKTSSLHPAGPVLLFQARTGGRVGQAEKDFGVGVRNFVSVFCCSQRRSRLKHGRQTA
jgi:hypothetical protein